MQNMDALCIILSLCGLNQAVIIANPEIAFCQLYEQTVSSHIIAEHEGRGLMTHVVQVCL